MSEKKENPLIPHELEIQILLGLPAKSLLRFKSICKNWQCLIESSNFSIRYSQISNIKNNNKIVCFRKDPISNTHCISVLGDHITEKVVDLQWPPFPDEGIEDKEAFDRDISVLGPVNGIYCIFNSLIGRWVGTLVLWNPATKEYKHIFPVIVLPMPSQFIAAKWNPDNEHYFDWKRPLGLDLGFGFDRKTNDYKVVVISHWDESHGPGEQRWHVRVYNLSTDCWRTIYYLTIYKDVISPFEGLYPPFPHIDTYPAHPHSLLNGVFHWSCYWNHQDLGEFAGIVAFDFVNESFQLIKGPHPSFDEAYRGSVWVLKETLAMIFCSTNYDDNPCNTIELWMLMEYGVEDTWAMIRSFGPIAGLSPIGIPNDHQIFYCDDKEQLISSELDHHETKEYGIYGLPLGILKYTETIESLKRIYQGEVFTYSECKSNSLYQ